VLTFHLLQQYSLSNAYVCLMLQFDTVNGGYSVLLALELSLKVRAASCELGSEGDNRSDF
jgi:hypothetical protein